MNANAEQADRRYSVVSVDDHVVEPPNVFQDRLPAKLRERGPRVVSTDDADVWEIDGTRHPITGLSAMAGRSFEEYTPKALRFVEMRPGCHDAAQRLIDMDADGVDAELLFGTLAGLAGGTFIDLAAQDAELAMACMAAYNDWLASEWCAVDQARLVPQCILPLWDLQAAAIELERCIGIGHKAALLPGLPHVFDLPAFASDAWVPLLSTCEEAGVPIALHIGGSIGRKQAAETLGALGPDAGVPAETLVASAPLTNYGVLANVVFSGVPVRYPKLKIVSVESGIGWIGYFLERMDWTYERHRFWTHSQLTEPPSHYFRRQIYGTFLVDDTGIDTIERIGTRNVMWESDYPHTDTTWPKSRELIKTHLGHLAPEILHDVIAGNAVRVYSLET
ncbi:MAG: amidohydrolase family protein [Actinomycetota bacterium]|nr:amidohydrolase family protein [Actinomycetota bacterium]